MSCTLLVFCFSADLTVNFNPVTYMIVEGGNAVLNAILNSPANREVTVQVRTVAGTATG